MKLSFEEISEALHESLEKLIGGPAAEQNENLVEGGVTPAVMGPEIEIEAVYPNEVVYCVDDVTYQAEYVIDDNGVATVTNPIQVKKEVSYSPLTFSAERLFSVFKESTTNDGHVVRSGKIFEAGDFPDKGVKFDESDLDSAVASFSPVENDLEHASTILDGKIGKLEKVWKQGSELFGEVSIPAWLDEAIGKQPIKVSLAFDRTKKIVGNALVLRPRITDAAIMSAFSAANGLTPNQLTGKKMNLKHAIKTFFGIENVEDLNQEIEVSEKLANITEEIAAATDPGEVVTNPEESAPVEEPVEEPAAKPEQSEFKASVSEESFAKLSAQFAALAENALNDKGLVFADNVIRSQKALPAQRAQIAAMFVQATKSDLGPEFKFSIETGWPEGSNVQNLKSFFEAAPAHKFAGESFPDFNVLPNRNHVNEAEQTAKIEKLLGLSDLGRAALKSTNGGPK